MDSADGTTCLAFPQFPDLPAELRHQIWLHALDNARVNRTISVAVHPELQTNGHVCTALGEPFCGRHDVCGPMGNGMGMMMRSAFCITNGYFASTRETSDIYEGRRQPPDPEDPVSRAALAGLRLACREANDIVLTRYPDTMRVYRFHWNPFDAPASRLVRCDPATDELVILSVGEHYYVHRTAVPPVSRPVINGGLMPGAFPQPARGFDGFKDLISRWKYVSFRYQKTLRSNSDTDEESNGDFDGEDEDTDEDDIYDNDGWPRRPDPLFMDRQFHMFVCFFESLRTLSIIFDPVPMSSSVVISDHARSRLEMQASRFIVSYTRIAKDQNEHRVEEHEHWTPKPKQLDQIASGSKITWKTIA
ncbi:hypothetical protein BX600DRAFT_468347 [Xylariales sp. PMI_506]|nr:hypothetical protein BX600DRAFT_468347 [Xylariales sp. PMI_506]